MLYTLVLMMGCDGTPTVEDPVTVIPTMAAADADGDGVRADEGDCNDFNAAILPGVDDTVGDGIDQDCDGTDGVDRDGDGFLDGRLGGDDCDDADDAIHPAAVESCNGFDDDCDFLIDDDDDDRVGNVTYTEDGDGDGFGAVTGGATVVSCDAPDGYVLDTTDCNDASSAVNPGAEEVCNTVDDDCDGQIDLDDPGYAGPQDLYYLDADADGHGDPTTGVLQCGPSPGRRLLGDDCDDTDGDWFLVQEWYADGDEDGYRGASLGDACTPPSATALLASALEDCNDGDVAVQVETDWLADGDGDGVGAGAIIVSCNAPANAVPFEAGDDCDDSDNTRFPGADDRCDDVVDADCDGVTCVPSHCEHVRQLDPNAATGVYSLDPQGNGSLRELWCDMDTDGGGWMRVAHGNAAPVDRGMNYTSNLADDSPDGSIGIYTGPRSTLPGNTDIRFSCKADAAATDWTVDLAFYDIHWYNEISGQTDTASCFNEGMGDGYDQPAPARRDLVNAAFLPSGDDWNSGYLSGEESCSGSSFVVDFDNGGLGVADATRWGREGSSSTCGFGSGDEYAVWIRPPSGLGFDADGDGQTFMGAGVGSEDDCDDADPFTGDGFPELCDGIDNDCDGLVDSLDPDVTFILDSVLTSTLTLTTPGSVCFPAGGVTVQPGSNITVHSGVTLSHTSVDGTLSFLASAADPVRLVNVSHEGPIGGTGVVAIDSDFALAAGVSLFDATFVRSTATSGQLNLYGATVEDSAIEGLLSLEDSTVLPGSTFTFAQPESAVSVTDNNVLATGVVFDLTSSTGFIDLSGNWWGTTDPIEVSTRILDSTDDPAINATAVIQPLLTSPSSTAP